MLQLKKSVLSGDTVVLVLTWNQLQPHWEWKVINFRSSVSLQAPYMPASGGLGLGNHTTSQESLFSAIKFFFRLKTWVSNLWVTTAKGVAKCFLAGCYGFWRKGDLSSSPRSLSPVPFCTLLPFPWFYPTASQPLSRLELLGALHLWGWKQLLLSSSDWLAGSRTGKSGMQDPSFPQSQITAAILGRIAEEEMAAEPLPQGWTKRATVPLLWNLASPTKTQS